MLNVVICDVDIVYRNLIESVVDHYQSRNPDDISMVLSSYKPSAVIDYLNNNLIKGSLYILDINLSDKTDGLSLGVTIRARDPKATIVYVSSHIDLCYLTFAFKVNALDFIPKDEPEIFDVRLSKCLSTAYDNCVAAMQPDVSTLDVSIRGQLRTVRLDDILYFKVHQADGYPLMLHMRNDTAVIDGDIDTFERILSKSFLRLNLSCLINKKNVLYINKKTSSLEMPDGCTFAGSKNMISNLFNELATNLINSKIK